VVVIGAGKSAVQIACELASVARVGLAVRRPVRFGPQRVLGRDIHFWLRWNGLDRNAAAAIPSAGFPPKPRFPPESAARCRPEEQTGRRSRSSAYPVKQHVAERHGLEPDQVDVERAAGTGPEPVGIRRWSRRRPDWPVRCAAW
jgi:cation diffusion facilitator CzcD-associated flavoprotein CzcO